MSLKSVQHNNLREKLLKHKIVLTNAENSALTVYFGVTSSKNLISEDSIALYHQGEAIYSKIMEMQ